MRFLSNISCVFDKKKAKTRLSKFLKSRSLHKVNDCFKNESNTVFAVLLQRLNKKSSNVGALPD